jgi:hypothetical protein
VTIQNASDGVSDRARCGHHRDRALLGARPGPLEQARQFHKNSRRIALGSRRFAGGKPNLALRHREAGDRIHQHQHVLAEIAEILGNGERQVGCLTAHERRFVRGGDNDDRARKAGSAEDPEKMPIRWPRQTVMKVLSARTPEIQRVANPTPE